MTTQTTDYICIGQIGRAHGIKGHVHLVSFIENIDLFTQEDGVCDENGTFLFRLIRVAPYKKNFKAEIEGVDDRNQSEALRHTKLYVPRTALPQTTEEDEFYHVDLIGAAAYLKTNEEPLGKIIGIHNFGAGDLVEILPKDKNNSFFLPFTKDCVPDIDIENARITICPPENFFDAAEPPEHASGAE